MAKVAKAPKPVRKRLASGPDDAARAWKPPGVRKDTPPPPVPPAVRRDRRQTVINLDAKEKDVQ